MLPLPASLFASPDAELEAEEAPWWGDTARLEAVERIDLVEVEVGLPVGYWPRVVIRSDSVTFDNRAWFLALPSSLRQRPEARAAFADEVIAPLRDGRATDRSLESVLERRVASVVRSMGALDVGASPLIVVPDASTPPETLGAVLRATERWSAVVAGEVGGRIRAVHRATRSPTDGRSRLELDSLQPLRDVEQACLAEAILDLGTGALSDPPWTSAIVPAVTATGSGCPGSARDATRAVQELAEACAPHWDALHHELAAAGRDPGSAGRCVVVFPRVVGDAEATLRGLDVLLDAGGAVHPASLAYTALRAGPVPLACDDARRVSDLPRDVLEEWCVPPGRRAMLLGAPMPRCGTGPSRSPPLVPTVASDLPPPQVARALPLAPIVAALLTGAVAAGGVLRWRRRRPARPQPREDVR